MKLPSGIITLIEEQAAAEYPQLYSFLAALESLDYFTLDQWNEMCRARRYAVIHHNVPRYVTNFMICLFILEEQGV